jgi:hypothetical protein
MAVGGRKSKGVATAILPKEQGEARAWVAVSGPGSSRATALKKNPGVSDREANMFAFAASALELLEVQLVAASTANSRL